MASRGGGRLYFSRHPHAYINALFHSATFRVSGTTSVSRESKTRFQTRFGTTLTTGMTITSTDMFLEYLLVNCGVQIINITRDINLDQIILLSQYIGGGTGRQGLTLTGRVFNTSSHRWAYYNAYDPEDIKIEAGKSDDDSAVIMTDGITMARRLSMREEERVANEFRTTLKRSIRDRPREHSRPFLQVKGGGPLYQIPKRIDEAWKDGYRIRLLSNYEFFLLMVYRIHMYRLYS